MKSIVEVAKENRAKRIALIKGETNAKRKSTKKGKK